PHPSLASLHPAAPPALSPLSLHDALPICTSGIATSGRTRLSKTLGIVASRRSGVKRAPPHGAVLDRPRPAGENGGFARLDSRDIDRKSTRLNSSHVSISYAVFCLKKKNIN